jgi:polysaccharide export outer membrane protein
MRVWAWICAAGLAGFLFTGCHSEPVYMPVPGVTPKAGAVAATSPGPLVAGQSAESIRQGDVLTIIFSDLPQGLVTSVVKVKEDGTVTLVENQSFTAAGKKRGDLEKEIRGRYVPNIYPKLTVNITDQDRFFYVDGEVKAPNKYAYTGPITVLKAITTAGSFTDFASRTDVKLTHVDGRVETINCKKALENPALDVPVYPDDRIFVRRKIFW